MEKYDDNMTTLPRIKNIRAEIVKLSMLPEALLSNVTRS